MNRTILCPISQTAAHHPEKIALIAGKEAWSYQRLDQEIAALRMHLNLSPGTKVTFLGAPVRPAIVLLFALLRAQAIAIPINPKLPLTARPRISHCLYLDPIPTVDPIPVHSPSYLYLDQLATFLLTSGSGKVPKIACLTVGNHYYSAIEAAQALNMTSESRSLLALPIFHVSGLAILMRSFLTGSTVVLSQGHTPQILVKDKISHVSLVPTQLYRLLQEPLELIQTLASTLHCVLIGGDHLPEDLHTRATLCHLPIATTYGMTEMSSMITLSTTGLLPKRKLKIAKDGEIWVGGKTLFAGYFDPDTQSIIQAPQWFPTGDICINEKRFVIGRKDRLFISGGENIQPEEIEEVLCSIPGIINACIVPISDPEFGHRPIAYILEDTPFHTLETIQPHLARRLPSFKHPIQILPFTMEMKESFKKVWNRNRCTSRFLDHNVNNHNVSYL